MNRKIKQLLLLLTCVVLNPVCAYCNDDSHFINVSNNNRGDKQRDEVPVVYYDEDNETLTVSFEEMTYQGLVTITVTNVLDGTSQTCVHSTTEEAMECAMSNVPGSYQILIVTDDGTEYEGYLTI